MRVSIHDLRALKAEGKRFVMLTAYDFPTAQILDRAGVPVLLVGDSVGRNVLGYPNELPVTMEEMLHHVKAVARGAEHAMVVGDMPFMSFQASRRRRRAQRGTLDQGRRRPRREDRGRPAGPGAATGRHRHPRHGAHRPDPPVRLRVGGHEGAGSRRGRHEGHGAGDATREGRRVRGGAGGDARRPRRGDLAIAADPDDRHRGGPRLRRAGPGDPRPPRPHREAAEAREGVRGPAGNDDEGGGGVHRRRGAGRVPRHRAQLLPRSLQPDAARPHEGSRSHARS